MILINHEILWSLIIAESCFQRIFFSLCMPFSADYNGNTDIAIPQPWKRDSWTKPILDNMPKHWMYFVKKRLHTLIVLIDKMLINIEDKSYRKVFEIQMSAISKIWVHRRCKEWQQSDKLVLTKICIQSWLLQYRITGQWDIATIPQLILNMTVLHFNLYPSLQCNKSNGLEYFFVEGISEPFKRHMCGRYPPHIIILPRHALIEYSMWSSTDYCLVLFYQLMDADLMQHTETNQEFYIFSIYKDRIYDVFPWKYLMSEFILGKQYQYSIYKILTRRISRIEINTFSSPTEFDIYDGPDLFCKKISFPNTRGLYSLVSGSFQVTVIHRYLYVNSRKRYALYHLPTVPKSVDIYILDQNNTTDIYLPNQFCVKSHIISCLYKVKASRSTNMFIKTVVKDMQYNGPSMYGGVCLYGGLAIYFNTNIGLLDEITLDCGLDNEMKRGNDFGFTTSGNVVAVYVSTVSYYPHSQLSATISFTLTPCEGEIYQFKCLLQTTTLNYNIHGSLLWKTKPGQDRRCFDVLITPDTDLNRPRCFIPYTHFTIIKIKPHGAVKHDTVFIEIKSKPVLKDIFREPDLHEIAYVSEYHFNDPESHATFLYEAPFNKNLTRESTGDIGAHIINRVRFFTKTILTRKVPFHEKLTILRTKTTSTNRPFPLEEYIMHSSLPESAISYCLVNIIVQIIPAKSSKPYGLNRPQSDLLIAYTKGIADVSGNNMNSSILLKATMTGLKDHEAWMSTTVNAPNSMTSRSSFIHTSRIKHLGSETPMSGIIVIFSNGVMPPAKCKVAELFFEHNKKKDIYLKRYIHSKDLPVVIPLVWPGCCKRDYGSYNFHSPRVMIQNIIGYETGCKCENCFIDYKILQVSLKNNTLHGFSTMHPCTVRLKTHDSKKAKKPLRINHPGTAFRELMAGFKKQTEALRQGIAGNLLSYDKGLVAHERNNVLTPFSCDPQILNDCFRTQISWLEAEQYCQNMNMTLPSFNSHSELEYFLSQMQTRYTVSTEDLLCLHNQYHIIAIYIGLASMNLGNNSYWSDGNPMNFHMFHTNRMSSIAIYKEVLKYFWFTQLFGQDDSCRFDSWNETTCLSKHDKVEFCYFSDWNAKFCFDSYNITMRKLSFIESLLDQLHFPKHSSQCTLMVVLLPNVQDIMWLPIPCHDKILDNATVYCTKKDSRYYSSLKKISPSLQNLTNFNEIIMYKCMDSSFISKYFLFDDTQDCPEKENKTKTENILKSLISPSQLCDIITHSNLKSDLNICLHVTSFSLLDENRIPKLQENNHCLFILDGSSKLIPNSNGQHLTRCEAYPCNHTYYKCPGFYCIPWQYVCNQRVDCPGGLDERLCERQQCTYIGQFRCRNSTMCIALENVCDSVDDCPMQEDEYFCDIFPEKCPFNCTCFLFVIECIGWEPHNVSQQDLQTRFTFPYVKITIRDANISDILSFLQQFHQVVELKLHNSYILDICQKWEVNSGRYLLRTLSLSFNNLTVLSRNCFSDMSLRSVNLSFNEIAQIMKYSFSNTEHLLIVDLSFNRITHLFPYTFSDRVSIKLLDLRGNLIIDAFPGFFNVIKITIILTDSFKVCCVTFTFNTFCNAKLNWPNSCGNLLHDTTSKILIWLVATLGLFLNFAALFVMQMKTKGEKNYKSMITSLALGDTSFCLCLLSIATSDAIYHGRYVENETKWRQSLGCFASCFLFLFSNFMSIFSIHLLSISRYFIVKNPLNSRCLDKKFILSLRVFGLILTMSISFSLVLFQKFFSSNGAMPTGLCLLIGNIDKSIIPSLVTWIFIFSEGMPIVSIPLINGLLIYEKIKWDREVKGMGANSGKISSKSIIIRLILASTSNLVCWIASTVLLFLTIVWERYPFSVLVWTTIIAMPFNTLINPFLFVFSMRFLSAKII